MELISARIRKDRFRTQQKIFGGATAEKDRDPFWRATQSKDRNFGARLVIDIDVNCTETEKIQNFIRPSFLLLISPSYPVYLAD